MRIAGVSDAPLDSLRIHASHPHSASRPQTTGKHRPEHQCHQMVGAAEGIEEVKTLDILCVAGYSCLFSIRIETPDVFYRRKVVEYHSNPNTMLDV
jgi:hypothetical protein